VPREGGASSKRQALVIGTALLMHWTCEPPGRTMWRTYYVYILASRIGGTLYVGVTSDLVQMVFEHKMKGVPGFTKKYDVGRLVYYEIFDSIEFAIRREKRLKKWNRAWKVRLIEEKNPNWDDLFPAICM
jgi:putative endonuclease